MQGVMVDPEWLRWTLALIIGFPLAVLILNETIVWLRQKEKPLVATVRILRNLLLPILALLLFLAKVLELPENGNLIRLVTTLAWIVTIHAFLSAFKVLVFDEAAAGTWQSQVPDIFLDLIRFFLVFCMAAMVLSTVWKVDLGGLLTALGVGSLVIGLALQDTLKNLFSGILLLFERPFTLGDWLQVGETIGKVIQVTWRSVYLQTRSRSLVVIPNGVLAQGNFTNYSRPTPLQAEPIRVKFSYDDPPNKVMGILQESALATEGILCDPEPWVATIGYGDFAIEYLVAFFVDNYEQMPSIRKQFVSRIWYAAKRYHLTIPYPIQTEYHVDLSELSQPEPAAQVAEIMRSLPNFGTLACQLLEESQTKMLICYYAKDEQIFGEGERLTGLYLLLQGKVAIVVQGHGGNPQKILQLSRGEFFGESVLLAGEHSDVSAIAVEDVEVALLDAEVVGMLLEKMPRLAREFSELMRNRRNAAKQARNL